MPIRYKISGDKFKAGQLFGEGRHQLSILKNLMSFQNLKQLQRIARFEDGTIIKCLSCFDQDVVEVFVPLPVGEKEVMPRERIEIAIYPAFEVYDGNTYSSNFIGIVLCRGGGFEPPYEFIAKESLPRDLVDEPQGELPEERMWWDYYRGDLDDIAIPKSRRLEDIAPVGIAEPVKVNLSSTVSTLSVNRTGENYPYKECSQPDVCSDDVQCLTFCGICAEFYSYSRTEHFEEHYGVSYDPDSRHTERWGGYTYEGSEKTGKLKPVNLLGFQPSTFLIQNGSGTNHFKEKEFSSFCLNQCHFTCTEWLFGICVDGFWDCSAPTDVESLAKANIIPQNTVYDFLKRSEFHDDFGLIQPSYDYTLSEQAVVAYSDYWGGILSDDEYAIIYSESIVNRSTIDSREAVSDAECLTLPCYSPPEQPDSIQTISGGETAGVLNVILDNNAIQVKPLSRLMYSNARYHRVGELGIGLFFVVENDPFEYMYVYTSARDGETDCIQTEVFDVEDFSFYHPIPEVTDNDGNPVYGNGGMRLIRETITRPEEPLNS